jgi:hypothetical protein
MLEHEVLKLINSQKEGSYWDFKRQWHDNKVDLLHDIICLANAKHKGIRYLIIGIEDPAQGEFVQCCSTDPNRKTQAQLIDFMRDKPFLGGYRPDLEVHTIIYDEKQIDVIAVSDQPHKPYSLFAQCEDKGKRLFAGSIYTRVGDTNTPNNKTADLYHVEQMWRERFGLDLTPMDKVLMLLRQPDLWEGDIRSGQPVYCRDHPEFQIEKCNDWEGDEPYTTIFISPRSHFYEYAVKYHTTTLFTQIIVALDGFRHYVPAPTISVIENRLIKSCTNGCYCFYYDMDSVTGAFVEFLSDSIQAIQHLGFHECILYFQNEAERKAFEKSVQENIEIVAQIKPSQAAIASARMVESRQISQSDCYSYETFSKLKQFHQQWAESLTESER